MQPNKKTIMISLAVLLVLIAAIIIFKNNKSSDIDVTNTDTNTQVINEEVGQSGQTTTSKPPSKTSTSTTTKTYTVRDFINQEGLDNENCDIAVPAEGKVFYVTGYINPADVWEAQHSQTIIMRNISDISADALNLRLTSSGLSTLVTRSNKDKKTWMNVQVHGRLRGVLSQVSDICTKSFILETDSIKILN